MTQYAHDMHDLPVVAKQLLSQPPSALQQMAGEIHRPPLHPQQHRGHSPGRRGGEGSPLGGGGGGGEGGVAAGGAVERWEVDLARMHPAAH